MVRRIQIKSNDIANFFDEEGIVGEFEVALAVRLHAEQVEPALHGGFGNAAVLGHAAHAPLRGGVANVMVFLASDYSSYMTGETVSVSSQRA